MISSRLLHDVDAVLLGGNIEIYSTEERYIQALL